MEKRAYAGKGRVVEIFNASFAINETKSELNDEMRKRRLQPLLNESKINNNSSNFNMTCSTLGDSKIVSTVSENSTLNISKLQSFISPRSRMS